MAEIEEKIAQLKGEVVMEVEGQESKMFFPSKKMSTTPASSRTAQGPQTGPAGRRGASLHGTWSSLGRH